MARSFLIITLIPTILASVASGAPVKKVPDDIETTQRWNSRLDSGRAKLEEELPENIPQISGHGAIICEPDSSDSKHQNNRRGNGFCVPSTKSSTKPFPQHLPVPRPRADPNAPNLRNRLPDVKMTESIDLGLIRAHRAGEDADEIIRDMRLEKRGDKKEEDEEKKEGEEKVGEGGEDKWPDFDETELVLERKNAEDSRTDEDFARQGKIVWAQDSDGNWKFILKEEE